MIDKQKQVASPHKLGLQVEGEFARVANDAVWKFLYQQGFKADTSVEESFPDDPVKTIIVRLMVTDDQAQAIEHAILSKFTFFPAPADNNLA